MNGRTPPPVWLLERLAAEGVDVSALLTGAAPVTAPVPLVDRFLPGGRAGRTDATVLDVWHVLARFSAVGTYAVLLNDAAAGAVLGGEPSDRPRPGDVVVVVTDVAAAVEAARTARVGSPSEEPAGKTLVLPPPVVVPDGAATLSLDHRVRLNRPADAGSLRGPLTAEPVDGASAVGATAGPLRAFGYVAWRAGSVGRA